MSNDGKKYDRGKARFDLIPPKAELEVAKVLTFGAEKYGANNWMLVDRPQERYLAAARRHINELQRGHATDDETGLSHLAHAVCCLLFLLEMEKRDPE